MNCTERLPTGSLSCFRHRLAGGPGTWSMYIDGCGESAPHEKVNDR